MNWPRWSLRMWIWLALLALAGPVIAIFGTWVMTTRTATELQFVAVRTCSDLHAWTRRHVGRHLMQLRTAVDELAVRQAICSQHVEALGRRLSYAQMELKSLGEFAQEATERLRRIDRRLPDPAHRKGWP